MIDLEKAHLVGTDLLDEHWIRVPVTEMQYVVEEGKNLLLYDTSTVRAELVPAFALESYLKEEHPLGYVHIPVSENLIQLPQYTRELTLRFHYTWINALKGYLYTDEFKKLVGNIKRARSTQVIYPSHSDIFRVFLFPLPAIKCVWLGLSPYQSEQACGIAFAVEKGSAPPSLSVLEEGMRRDPGLKFPANFSLDKQLLPLRASGVFLLNASLTTNTVDPRAHVEHWSPLIMRVIQVLNYLDISWVLWGKVAASYARYINPSHTIYKLAHPSWYARTGTVMETDVFSDLHVHNGICFN